MEQKDIIVPELNNATIESMIYTVRGQRVMLDFELAQIYGYTTKSFNQQVNRNINKFPDRYRFQLVKAEIDDLVRSQIVTTRNWGHTNEGGRRYLPYAFTEQGVYMLMTVLKGDLATKQSIALIDAFKEMKDYIIEVNNVLTTDGILKLVNQVNNNTIDIKEIKKELEHVMDNFIDPKMYKHFLILNGEQIEADIAYKSIYGMAKKSVYIFDDYVNLKTLLLLKACKKDVEIIIFTDNKARDNLTIDYVEDFKNDTGNKITIKANNHRFHDRYIIIDYGEDDEKIYHCGASSKDAGKKITTIESIDWKDGYQPLIDEMLKSDELGL